MWLEVFQGLKLCGVCFLDCDLSLKILASKFGFKIIIISAKVLPQKFMFEKLEKIIILNFVHLRFPTIQ